jgi:DNA (cytosine-5)-methyltransferase 1
MRHASLFSGIGGFDLAAEWIGWENVFHCDINPFGKKVLEYYYPNSISYGDITKTDFSIHRGEIDILTGGFPCQPYSLAGKRKGKEDERHLFPQMLRAIREIQPRWIIGENVYGLVNWDGGLVFHEVQSDLEAEGYEVFPYVLPACSINAPHRRDRVFFIAYSNDIRCNECNGEYAEQSINGRLDALNDISKMSAQESSTYTDGIRLRTQSNRIGKSGFSGKNKSGNYWQTFPTVSPICDGDDGISDRLDSITFSKWRKQSIMAGGNAVVPQLIYVLFKTISKFEQLKSKQ